MTTLSTDTHDKSSIFAGRYTRGFLDGIIGKDKYTIRTYSLNDFEKDSSASSWTMEDAQRILNDETLSLAYVSDTKMVAVWMHEYPGWLSFCEPLGLTITPSPKLSKRLTVLTRLSFLHMIHREGENPDFPTIKLGQIGFDEFSDISNSPFPERFVDGANVISYELYSQMVQHGNSIAERIVNNPFDKSYMDIVDGAGSYSLRILTAIGQIKGDTFVAPRERMGGYDVLYPSCNLKTEVKSRDFTYVLAEPHPNWRKHTFSGNGVAPPPVYTDDQSMMWLGEWLYDREMLKMAMKDFVERTRNELEAGKYPKFFTQARLLDDPYTTQAAFQQQALEWERNGPGKHTSNPGASLKQSVFLQERIAHGAINMLTKKHRWPVPCAAYVHVATDSWLHMAGYDDAEEHPWPFDVPFTPRGYAWLHERTGRLIYNDEDFAELYDRHGGWDLDDSVKVHFRTMDGQKILVNVRSPNTWGEYDIKKYVEGTPHVSWYRSDGTVVDFPDVSNNIPQFCTDITDINYRFNDMSPRKLTGKPPILSGPEYTADQCARALQTSLDFRGVFGRYVNAEMVYFHTVGDYRRDQLAPIEAVVDSCTQEQSDAARELITAEIEKIVDELVAAHKPVDKVLWQQRLKKMRPGVTYVFGDWYRLVETHKMICNVFRDELMAIAQCAPKHVDNDIIKLGTRNIDNGRKFVDWYYQLMRSAKNESETQAEFCRRINDIMAGSLFSQTSSNRKTIYDIVLGMAAQCYTHQRNNAYNDTPLFQISGIPSSPSIFNYYLEAIVYYGIGDEQWTGEHFCSGCNSKTLFYDRLVWQSQAERLCSSCS